MPLANAFLNSGKVNLPEPTYELHAQVCSTCFLVQVNDAVPPKSIFTKYAYFSSYSATWVRHAQDFAELAIAQLQLNHNSLVIEIASNDGYLLQHFASKNIPVLGVDPALIAAEKARDRNVPTETFFFNSETATQLRKRYPAADLMVANNVLAHVPDINNFLSGFRKVLQDQGVVSFEFPHVLNLLELVQFDTIYHEHFSYLSLHSVEICLARHGLRAFDVEELPTHGGSLRLWACHSANTRPDRANLDTVRQKEKDFGIATPQAYEGFTDKVTAICADLRAFLQKVKARTQTVAAYGAAAKGNTLLNYCGITTAEIDFVVDANPHKQGTLLPGSHIPVRPPSALQVAKPDYVIILPWNIASEIIVVCDFVKEWGGRFVLAIPSLRILA